MTKKTIAIFDFDGTLTTGRSSRLMFFKHLVGRSKLFSGLFMEYCQHGMSKLNLFKKTSRGAYLDNFLLNGFSQRELRFQAENFITHILVNHIRKEALERLYFHQKEGHICMIISGALDIYLKPWAKQYQIEEVICTELEFDPITGKSTGRMLNPYCLGQEKVEQFKKLYSNRNDYIIYAYGDSPHDLELLNYADHAFYKCFN
ncbi:HAD-IB family hydrolase [Legionella hackeliae]|uniref:Phosphoserine phosphatase n=1 Tax=Legionella hackeliae TaxID=449 RepID=A0A0A8UQ88_LEGHA|nr:HAD-IB family hydrolase [Legionella hackeliae]KTD09663.1 haloacid dehalogenase-like hydrolase [Legionella hackeliae]CEK11020.1 Phosphoserine phosphatase [Legionella hackeliae]STX47762.1 HAD hydrolase, family IB [Legionella hackeliae]